MPRAWISRRSPTVKEERRLSARGPAEPCARLRRHLRQRRRRPAARFHLPKHTCDARRQADFVTAHTTRVAPGTSRRSGRGARRPHDRRERSRRDGAGGPALGAAREKLSRPATPSGSGHFGLAAEERQTCTVVGITADLVSTQMGNPVRSCFCHWPAARRVRAAIARGAPSMRLCAVHSTTRSRRPSPGRRGARSTGRQHRAPCSAS